MSRHPEKLGKEKQRVEREGTEAQVQRSGPQPEGYVPWQIPDAPLSLSFPICRITLIRALVQAE